MFVGCVQRIRTVRAEKEEQARLNEQNRQRQMAIDAEQGRIQLLVYKGHSDGSVMQVIDSANLCNANGKRTETLKKIATEKRYAQQVGVVNLSDLEDLKQELRDVDEQFGTATTELRRFRKNALRCTDPKVTALQRCYDFYAAKGKLSDQCSDDSMRVRIAIFCED